jgi:hypothetical protein
VKLSGKPSQRDNKYVDIYREKPIRVICKVLVPVREHPKVKCFIVFVFFLQKYFAYSTRMYQHALMH